MACPSELLAAAPHFPKSIAGASGGTTQGRSWRTNSTFIATMRASVIVISIPLLGLLLRAGKIP